MGAIQKTPYKMVYRVLFINQPLLHLTCCREVYFAQIFDFSLVSNMSLACKMGGYERFTLCLRNKKKAANISEP